MKQKPEFSTTWYCKFMFAVGVIFLITCYMLQPADERIKPNPVYDRVSELK